MDHVAAEGETSPAQAAPAAAGHGFGVGPSGPARGPDPAAFRRMGGDGAAHLLSLQRTAGNQAVGALLRRVAAGEGEVEQAVQSVHGVLARSEPDRGAIRRATGLAIQRADEEGFEEGDGAVALDDAPAAGGSGGGVKASFDHSGGSTVTINADTAPDFARNITATIGSPHTSPEFEPDIQFDVLPGGAKKITSIGLTVRTAITKVRFGMGRVNDKHKAAINEMVAAIKAHEEKHRAIIESEAAAALTAAQKFVGTGKVDAANKAITTELECASNKKHEALDASEGLLTAAEQADGSVTVTKSASGAKYPCKTAGAKK